jgi:lipopolysaccharide export system permease protein
VLILERYIIRQVSAPLVAICTVLIMIFAGYSAVRFLNDAVNGLLSGGTVIVLVGLKLLIAFEVLLPVTFYLAIVLALSRLYADGEITGMEACGVSPGRVMTSILGLSLLVALVVTGLAIYARPWAYQKVYTLQTTARSEFDFAKIEAGRFYEMGDNVVFFAEELDSAARQARNVWVWELGSGKREVTSAQKAYEINTPQQGHKALVFQNGYHYTLHLKKGNDRLVHFERTVYQIKSGRTPPSEYRRKAAPTSHLARSSNSEDIAEFQWRLSTGLSTILMSLLAILLSRVAPRSGKYGKMTPAIVLFFLFYNLSLIAKNWVEKGVVAPVPGIWWVNLLSAALAVALLLGPGLFWHRRGTHLRTGQGAGS